ncbi:hypothetical protein HDU98_005794, partial [Podochytrium sp. JEL0797]
AAAAPDLLPGQASGTTDATTPSDVEGQPSYFDDEEEDCKYQWFGLPKMQFLTILATLIAAVAAQSSSAAPAASTGYTGTANPSLYSGAKEVAAFGTVAAVAALLL